MYPQSHENNRLMSLKSKLFFEKKCSLKGTEKGWKEGIIRGGKKWRDTFEEGTFKISFERN
jgi:hypothetical protein